MLEFPDTNRSKIDILILNTVKKLCIMFSDGVH